MLLVMHHILNDHHVFATWLRSVKVMSSENQACSTESDQEINELEENSPIKYSFWLITNIY